VDGVRRRRGRPGRPDHRHDRGERHHGRLVRGGPVNIAASILPTRWGLAATASSIDLTTVSPNAAHDQLWQHTTGQWATDLAWLAVLTLTFFLTTVFWLGRKLNRPD
jgi:hypothetical protein